MRKQRTPARSGPATLEGRAVAMLNLQDPQVAALTHQANRFLDRALAPSCDKCFAHDDCERYLAGGTCRLAEEYQADVLAELMKVPHVQPVDAPLAREYAKTATALAIIDTYVSHSSPFLPGTDEGHVEAQPVMRQRASLSAQLVRLASELGLSPMARQRLRDDGKAGPGADLAAALSQLAAESRAKASATVDADFAAVEGNDHGQAAVEHDA